MEYLTSLYQQLEENLRNVESNRYSLNLRENFIEAWSFENNPAEGITPCRFLISPLLDYHADEEMDRPSIHVDYANSEFCCNYRIRTSVSQVFKVLMLMRIHAVHLPESEGQTFPFPLNKVTLLGRSRNGFSDEEFARALKGRDLNNTC